MDKSKSIGRTATSTLSGVTLIIIYIAIIATAALILTALQPGGPL